MNKSFLITKPIMNLTNEDKLPFMMKLEYLSSQLRHRHYKPYFHLINDIMRDDGQHLQLEEYLFYE